MYKDNAVGNVVAETGRDFVFGITARLSDLSMPLTGEVRRSPEPSARVSAATNSESGKFVRRAYSRRALDCAYAFRVPSCAVYKDNAVANVAAEMGRYFVSTTARLSDLSMPLKGEVQRSHEQSDCTAADSEER